MLASVVQFLVIAQFCNKLKLRTDLECQDCLYMKYKYKYHNYSAKRLRNSIIGSPEYKTSITKDHYELSIKYLLFCDVFCYKNLVFNNSSGTLSWTMLTKCINIFSFLLWNLISWTYLDKNAFQYVLPLLTYCIV